MALATLPAEVEGRAAYLPELLRRIIARRASAIDCDGRRWPA